MNFLNFSDAAKFADIARNLTNGLGYSSSFSFWGGVNNASAIQPGMPVSISVFFRIFGVNDVSVITTSLFFYTLILVFTYLIARNVFNKKLIAWLSTVAVAFNYDIFRYSVSGASESLLIFELVAGAYFISLRRKLGVVIAALFLVSMYFSRPQAIIYIFGIVIYYIFQNFASKKAFLYSIGVLVLGSVGYLLFSRQGAIAITQNLPGVAVSDSLRGGVQSVGFLVLFNKLFYNLYNFYKLLPQIINPYLFALFVIGIIRWGKNRIGDSFKIASIFMILATFLVAALTIPFFRYLHPVIPLVYIIGVDTLIWILSQTYKGKHLIIASTIFILFFAVGQTLGILLLDSRFERNTHNVGKPPVYVQLSYLLRDNTNKDQVIVTNLDTWGSWYGERKTVWFPLNPKQLINSDGQIPFDGIYLTSYLIDDENYYMGSDWRMIFDNPMDSSKWTCDGCDEISKQFGLKGVYKVPASDNYERQDASAILLIKK